MTELYIDSHTMLRMSRALKARQDALDADKSKKAADAEYERVMHMAFKPEHVITSLAEIPQVNDALLPLLESDLKVKALKRALAARGAPSGRKATAEALAAEEAVRDALWDKYEVIRRVAAGDDKSLILTKS